MNKLMARTRRTRNVWLVIVCVGFLTVAAVCPSFRVLNGQVVSETRGAQLVPQLGPSAVYAAVLSSDGKFALTSSLGVVRLWDSGTGQIIRLFKGQTGLFAPDGMHVLVDTRLLEIETGREVRRFEGRAAPFGSVFSIDGRYLLTSDKTVARLWELGSGREVRQFKGHTDAVKTATLSPDGKYVVTAGEDKTARLWDAQTGDELRQFVGHAAAVSSAVCSPAGKYVLTTSDADKTVRLWDMQTGREVRRFQKDLDEYLGIIPATFSPSGKYVLTGSWYTAALMWETESGREVRRFPHSGPVQSALFSADGKFVLVAGVDKAVQLWDVQTAQVVRRFEGYSNTVNSVAYSPDGKYLLASDGEGGGHLWDIDAGREVRRFKGSSTFVYCAVFSPDGKYVLLAGNDETAHLFETATGQEKPRLKGHSSVVYSAIFSREGKYILTASSDNTARLWNAETGKQIHKFSSMATNDDATTHASASFSPDGNSVLTEWGHQTAQTWDVKTGNEIARFKGHTNWISSAVYSPDGKYVLTASFDKTARLWDAQSGRELLRYEGHTGPYNSAAFSPDGRYVLTASSDNKVLMFETSTAKRVSQFDVESGAFLTAVFSPDGKYVLAANIENTVWLWETASGRLRGKFEGQPDGLYQDVNKTVALSPDGNYLLTAQEDGTIRFGSVTTGKQLCQLMSFQDGTWNIVTPEGQFDTSDVEEVRGLRWIMPDEPMRPLPLEIFMRDYYEPRLLSRILKGETFANVRSLSDLNRVQPPVKILDVRRQGESDLVTVTVEVARAQSERQRDKEGRLLETGVYDLRLFRDGQLVGRLSDGAPQTVPSLADEHDRLLAWRTESEVRLNQDGRRVINFENVRLPRTANSKQIEFSAYAFNEDRVKSETDRKSFNLPADLTPLKGRAYVVMFGVNASGAECRSLDYAVNDVRKMQETFVNKLKQSGRYEEVVEIPLIADYGSESGGVRVVTEKSATKENLKTVFDLLGGRQVDERLYANIPNAARLKPARPEDMLMIFFSSHGDSDGQGNFYIMPYDTAQRMLCGVAPLTDEDYNQVLTHSISSEELSLWLRYIDAGEMIMIVDACHSAAAVESGGFKPGPMGSRGLGQLAYDKRMKILAATQGGNVAREFKELNQSLLSYVLSKEGIEDGRADFNPADQVVTTTEWLQYGEARVPEWYKERRQEMAKREQADATESASQSDKHLVHGGSSKQIQVPSLFDFTRRKQDSVLFRKIATRSQ